MKILVCFGTRPEAIKMAPVIRELEKEKLDFKICVTSQHREMLNQVLDFFEILPHYDLDLMRPDQSLNSLSALILDAVDKVFDEYEPDLILVQGDTTTAAMVGLAAFHRNIKVGHIEAGLRTNNKRSPFPEELNRQLIGRIADYHFAPTQLTAINLKEEKIPEHMIFVTGNTVVDALKWSEYKMDSEAKNIDVLRIQDIIMPGKKMILVTGHRRENFGAGLRNICNALEELSHRGDIQIVYPVHLNPKVKGPVEEILSGKPNIDLIPPVSYPAMLWLMKNASLIISDSGGIQEEAPSFNKTVIVTREYTERMEGVDAGYCILTGADKTKIVREANRCLDNLNDNIGKENPYGDGLASARIVKILKEL